MFTNLLTYLLVSDRFSSPDRAIFVCVCVYVSGQLLLYPSLFTGNGRKTVK